MRTLLAVTVALALLFAFAAPVARAEEEEAEDVAEFETEEEADEELAFVDIDEEVDEEADEEEADEAEMEAEEETTPHKPAPHKAAPHKAAPHPAKAPAKPATPAAPAAPAAAGGSSITEAELVGCMKGLSNTKANAYLQYINAAQAQAQINTCLRKAAWLAQLGHESGSLVYMQELASGAAYEGRKDLGNTHPGDGKKYKGRGPIQLTGRANYQKAGAALGLDLVGNPTQVATPQVGFRTSAWFWQTHGLNALADAKNFAAITKRINGGTNGAADRNARYAKCKTVLKC